MAKAKEERVTAWVKKPKKLGGLWTVVYHPGTFHLNKRTGKMEPDRKTHRLGRSEIKTPAQARVLADEFLETLQTGSGIGLTIGEYIDQIYSKKIATLKFSSRQQAKYLMGYIKRAFGSYKFGSLTASKIEDWLRELATTPITIGVRKRAPKPAKTDNAGKKPKYRSASGPRATRPGLSYKTQWHLRTALSALFKHAFENGVCRTNPAEGALLHGKNRGVMVLDHLDPEQAKALVEALQPPAREMVQLSLLALGEAELTGLVWGNVNYTDKTVKRQDVDDPTDVFDLKPRCLRISRNHFKGHFGTTKTENRERLIPLAPIYCEMLRRRHEASQWKEGHDLVFPSPEKRDRPVNTHNLLSRKITPTVKRLGLPHYTWHAGRRTFSSISGAYGRFSRIEQKRVMGHGDKDITDHYTHVEWEHFVESMNHYVSLFGFDKDTPVQSLTPQGQSLTPSVRPVAHPLETPSEGLSAPRSAPGGVSDAPFGWQ
ncbi:MAG TPA: tyrosine-type recombinase/integrase [Bryobacteraceae bacterium]|jgi:integrase